MSSGSNHKHGIFLGIDGGGTKTHAVIVDAAGNKISEGIAGPSNPLRTGVENAVANILEASNRACDGTRFEATDIRAAVAGLAGVRRQDLRDTVRQRLESIFETNLVTVVTDAEIAWYGTTAGHPGIVIIAGTGSICFGKNGNGEIATAGGWGPIAGDEGGGANVARRALQSIAKALDGRGRPTMLSEVAAEYFRASTAEDLIVAIYSPLMDNMRLAGFARCVVESAKEGDEIAIEHIAEAGFELGIAAYAVIKKLHMLEEEVPVGMVGSMFKAGALLKEPLLETVRAFAPGAYLVEPQFEPAHAAALMSVELIGIEA